MTQAVEVTYDLFDLPTAQHKAGLAGLLLAIRSLKERSEKAPEVIPPESVPEIVQGPDDTGVKVRFTERSTQGLLDDLYDAAVVEVAVRSRWQGAAPKREETVEETDPKTNKPRAVKRFVYDTVQPKGAVLAAWLPDIWMKLWRDMLWQIPRAIPMTRRPFVQRSQGKPCDEGRAAWQDLVKAQDARQSNKLATGEVAGSLWLGAQAFNAEGVPFVGRLEQNLLLHFWPLTVLPSVPQRINSDGSSEFVGFVLAIPEVARLKRFCEKLPGAFAALGAEARGFRPARAVIDLPAQGALEFVNSVARVKVAEQEDSPARSVGAVEFLHLDRQGNNVKLLASGRVPPDLDLLDAYRAIAGQPGESPRYRNPLFRAALIQALLRGKPWWGELLALFMSRDWRFFVFASGTASEAPEIAKLGWFWTDVGRRFDEAVRSLQTRQEALKHMSPQEAEQARPAPAERMAEVVRRLVAKYVMAKARERSKERPERLNEEKEHIAQSLFLEFRSRRDQAFVDHFAATFFAVGQWFDNAQQDFHILSNYLLDRDGEGRGDLKTMTLAALSAVSWVPQAKEKQGDQA
jgi:CRISPR-associated protein Cmx8